MAVDVATFRQNFPAFANTTKFPDDEVSFWLMVAYQFVNPCRWGTATDLGAQLYAGHMLAVEAKGIAPTVGGGPLSAKTVDKVSMSYDTSVGIEPNAGHWNLSTYGTRFIRYALMAGAGGMQVSPNPQSQFTDGVFGPWPG